MQEIGTLKDLNVQPGDVVECVSDKGAMCSLNVGQRYVIGDDGLFADEQGDRYAWSYATFSIVSRATPAEPASEIEWGEWESKARFGYKGDMQFQRIGDVDLWRYPVPKQPVVETVRLLTGKAYGWLAEPEDCCGSQNTHRITLTIIDGVVQPIATVEAL